MPKPTVRVLALLEILQSGGRWTTARLADRLGVDERTVRRYVAHLVELEVPVRSVRGRHGGYRLAPGYRLPPLMFTDDEAVAVLLALVTTRRLASAVVPDQASTSAADKIRRVLPEALARRTAALLDSARFTDPVEEGAAPGAAAGPLLVLADAARARRPVVVDYTDRHGERTTRTLHPYGLVIHSRRWYLVAGQPDDDRVRTFRLDRLDAPAVRPGTFTAPTGLDLVEHVVAGLEATPWHHEVRVLVQAGVDDVVARLPSGLAAVAAAEAPGWVRVNMRAERLDWVPALLAGLGRPFVVEAPAELRLEVSALGRRLLAAADVPEQRDQVPSGAVPPPGHPAGRPALAAQGSRRRPGR